MIASTYILISFTVLAQTLMLSEATEYVCHPLYLAQIYFNSNCWLTVTTCITRNDVKTCYWVLLIKSQILTVLNYNNDNNTMFSEDLMVMCRHALVKHSACKASVMNKGTESYIWKHQTLTIKTYPVLVLPPFWCTAVEPVLVMVNKCLGNLILGIFSLSINKAACLIETQLVCSSEECGLSFTHSSIFISEFLWGFCS